MRSTILLIAGAILISIGVFLFFILGMAFGTASDFESMPDGIKLLLLLLQYGIGGLVAGIGLILFLFGLKGRSRDAKQAKLNAHIAQTGIKADATVTFVDKNRSIRINKQAIYSIVEYTYQDGSGREHVRRIDNISTELVKRQNIKVGKKVKIKYLQEDPSQSVILL